MQSSCVGKGYFAHRQKEHGKVGKTAIVQKTAPRWMFSLLGLWERHLQWVHRIYLFRVLFVSCSFPGHAWGMFPWNREQCSTLHQPAQQQSIPPCLICSQEPFSDHVMGSFFSILPSSHFRQHCYRYTHYHGIKKKRNLNIMQMRTNI